MLYLIGLGLYDEKDISLRGIDIAKDCDEIFLEGYTSVWRGKDELKEELGGDVKEVDRSSLEEKSDKIIDLSEDRDVAVMIPGDPLVATTHTELIIQARERGIKTQVIHSSSIYSAVAETGLQIYKFGKTTTIPKPEENYKPESPYEAIKENQERGLHTLVLLDIKEGEGMKVKEGLSYLLDIERKRNEEVIKPNHKAVVFSAQGKESQILYDEVDDLIEKDIRTPSVIIVPGKLHEKESEALKLLG